MQNDRLKVALTRRLPDVVEKRLAELFDVRLRDSDTPLSKADLIKQMQDVDVIVPAISDVIDADVGASGPKLKLIANFGAGFDNIDVATALQRGILVSNTPGVVTEDTADMTMALMLAVTRRIPRRAFRYAVWSLGWLGPNCLYGQPADGKTFGHFGNGADWARSCSAC